MDNDWQSPKVEKPPQGTKVLWFKNGDLFVCQRWGDIYLQICKAHNDKSPIGVDLGEPLLWKLVKLPDPYTGKITVSVGGSKELFDLDELERLHPESYNELLAAIKKGT